MHRTAYLILLLTLLFSEAVLAAPRWTKQTPIGRNHVYAVGLGESTVSLSETRKAAISNAMSTFNVTQGVTLNSKLTLQKIEDSNSYRESVVHELEVQGTSSTLTGLKLVNTYVDRNSSPYRVYALMSLPTENPFSYWSPVWRSAILPGWGQFYQGRINRGVLYLTAEAISVGGAFFTASAYTDRKNKANQATNVADRRDFDKQADEYYQANVVLVCVAVAAYGLNLADVLLLSNNKADIYYSLKFDTNSHGMENPAVLLALSIPLKH